MSILLRNIREGVSRDGLVHTRSLSMTMIRACGAALAIVLCGAQAFAQTAPAAAPAAPPAAATTAPAAGPLVVAGDVTTPLSIAAADLKAMPRKTVDVQEDGRTLHYEGVLVAEILKRAGVPLGSDLRGNALATYMLASASDGYQVLFSLAELDPAFTGNDIIIADTIDGKPLFAYQGPLRIVAPKDSRGARSIRMLQRLEIVRLRK